MRSNWLIHNKLTRPTEVMLLKADIKPAILLPYGCKEHRWILNCMPNIHSNQLDSKNHKFVLMSKNKSHIKSIRDEEEIGIELGYYPESCNQFKHAKWGVGLDFNGICFNPGKYTNEAIAWCEENYGSKMLEAFGIYYYALDNHGEVVESKIVTR